MTKEDVALVAFDSALWALSSCELSAEAKAHLLDEVRNIFKSANQGYAHEKYARVAGVWTQSGGTPTWTLAETCANKRESFLLLTSGAVIAILDKEIVTLRPEEYVKVSSLSQALIFAAPGTRITRVFSSSQLDVACVAKELKCQPQ